MKELCRKTCLHSINRFKLLVAQFFVLFFLPLHCFNWKIVAFKNFVVFCHTSSRINHRYTPMSPPSRTSCPSLSPSHPSRLYTAPVLVPWVIWQIPIGYVCYIWYYTFPCYSIHFEGIQASQVALVIKNPPANAGDARDAGLIPASRKSLAVGNGNPLQYSCLGNFMDRGSWWVQSVHGVLNSLKEWLST